MRQLRAAPQTTGHDVREFRKNLNWNQERLAKLLGVSKAYVQQIESVSAPAPLTVAERIFGARQLLRLAEALRKNVADKQPRNFHDFRRSRNFSVQPPFSVLPRCQCGNPRCNLTPIKDGDWDSRHLWKFQGIRCRKIVYVSSEGKVLPAPRELTRDSVLRRKCNQCGRQRDLARKFRPRLGANIIVLYCRRRKADNPGLKHDPPELFLNEEGRVRTLTPEELGKLRGRSTRGFSVPTCKIKACPRLGKTMERSAILRLQDGGGAACEIATYRCRSAKPATPHAEYRVLPNGEAAQRVGLSLYTWKDAESGKRIETHRRARPVRSDRVMPAAKCRFCDADLRKVRGPWKLSRGMRWKAVCRTCGKSQYVKEDGTVQFFKDTRFRSSNRSQRSGMTSDRIKEAVELSQLVAATGGKRGALKSAAARVYQGVRLDLAYDRARQTLKDWKRAGRPDCEK
jgi:DNA-binding XRE family transcriptional regulator